MLAPPPAAGNPASRPPLVDAAATDGVGVGLRLLEKVPVSAATATPLRPRSRTMPMTTYGIAPRLSSEVSMSARVHSNVRTFSICRSPIENADRAVDPARLYLATS